MDHHADMLHYLIENLRSAELKKTPKIIAGGPPFRNNPNLVEQYGIDATAHDARSAVRVASALF
jgi:methanogenic corrinoid protein MtbC1